MHWFNSWFNEIYVRLYAHRDLAEATQAVTLLRSILPRDYRPIVALDIACGNGRHLTQLTAFCDLVVGMDLSTTSLAEAQKSILSSNDRSIYLIQADMRYLPVQTSTIDLITNFFTSFGYFDSEVEHQDTLNEWTRVLSPQGMIYIDFLNKEYVIRNLVPYSERTVDNMRIREIRTLQENPSRVNKEIQVKSADGTRTFFESVRLFTLADFKAMTQAAGLVIDNVFGDLSGAAYDSSRSERLIMTAHKQNWIK